jgi:hypothetical protein
VKNGGKTNDPLNLLAVALARDWGVYRLGIKEEWLQQWLPASTSAFMQSKALTAEYRPLRLTGKVLIAHPALTSLLQVPGTHAKQPVMGLGWRMGLHC